ncbi:DUF1659 domain-containing protein [Clostridium fungisolvens]|uniref:DUF1659 domain-containing protein n=1 Tax=Clostridium fungisolvens TaxID=1604897 RepID=A0A6V8SNG7_9CLOT|nr:DUF1659 domain-containing protein [Clostridium fungisolvens]GFP76403.1 hypothetical protein bsdtw1_02505 [Clostridium fungisolvens]
MATAILSGNSMIIKYKNETNENGDDIFRTVRFPNVRLDVSDDDFYAVGQALSSLMPSDAIYIRKQQDYLVEDI